MEKCRCPESLFCFLFTSVLSHSLCSLHLRVKWALIKPLSVCPAFVRSSRVWWTQQSKHMQWWWWNKQGAFGMSRRINEQRLFLVVLALPCCIFHKTFVPSRSFRNCLEMTRKQTKKIQERIKKLWKLVDEKRGENTLAATAATLGKINRK